MAQTGGGLMISGVTTIIISRCGHDTTGCDADEDCDDGLECVGEGTDRKCFDIDECEDPR